MAVARQPDTAALAAEARATGRLGVDTEFVSEGHYQAQLCLVGVAVGGRVELLDPLADGLDPRPLAEVLADPDVEVVVHAGWQDIAILRRVWRCQPRNIFDTQIAAGFAGFSAQAGYSTLLTEALGLKLPKTASFTRWDVRPLTPEQIAYARDDVAHLLPLADALKERLRRSGRLEWAREECRRLEEASDARDPLTAYLRLPKVSQLTPVARALARELAAWRERTAAAEDRPVGTVLGDAALLEIARRRPTTLEGLSHIRGLQPSAIRRRGEELLAAVRRGIEAGPLRNEPVERQEVHPGDAPLIALAEALVRARAQAAGLAYELVAARSDLARIVSASRRNHPEPDVRTLQGWRRDLVGEELLRLLKGRLTLAVDPASGRIQVGERG